MWTTGKQVKKRQKKKPTGSTPPDIAPTITKPSQPAKQLSSHLDRIPIEIPPF